MDKESIIKICKEIRQESERDGVSRVIGFTCSSFDLLHSGHYLMLEDCKNHCDILIVGLQNDPSIDREYRVKTGGKNKNRPVQTYEERFIQISGVKYIDHIVKYSTESELYSLLKDINPDIRMIGEDWRGKEFTGHDLDIPIRFNPRTHSYSTSTLRQRVYEAEKQKLEEEECK